MYLKRFVRLIFVFLVVTFFTFWLLDQGKNDLAATKAGLNATPEAVAEIRTDLGLGAPPGHRLWR